ncbi:MAG: cell division protein FtsZ [Pseudoflavonifractor sp.]|nr:cell division protein FtsZ [Alloprevotella sp.]MCM1117431.1 cell division protein FtsZ [Pseudoflavonifractor sp.]
MDEDKDLNITGLTEQFAHDEANDARHHTIIKVIGVGGGGNNAVNHMYLQDIKNVSFVVCNTDRQALRNSPVPVKVQIGDGLGAGNKPEKARKAAEDDIDKIRDIFDDETKMVFVTAGMGGGTGTGAAPIVAREAKERGILTVGIVTIPFLFEGDRKILKALDGVDEMAKVVDALMVINNERLTEIYGDLDFMNAFGKADDTLSTAASSISELITNDGYMNLDFEDVDTTLRNGGAAIISSGYGEGEGRVTAAIKDALNSPLLKNRDILSSKSLLFNIYYSRNAQQTFKMSEAQEITEFVTSINPDVDVIWGVAFDDSLGEKVRITILAAGFEVTIRSEEGEETGRKVPPKWRPDKPEPAEKPKQPRTAIDIISEQYGSDKVASVRYNYITLTPEQMLDDAALEVFESKPTFTRDRKRTELPSSRPAATPEPEAPASAGTEIVF